MSTSTAFNSNRTQAVYLPEDLHFPDHVKKVEVRSVGNERIIAPANQAWDNFSLAAILPSDDFMAERVGQDETDHISIRDA